MTRSRREWSKSNLKWEGCDSLGAQGQVEWGEVVLCSTDVMLAPVS